MKCNKPERAEDGAAANGLASADVVGTRREFLRGAARGAGLLGLQPLAGTMLVTLACGSEGDARSLALASQLEAPDANGLRLRPGFESRVIARTGSPVGSSGYVWHAAPDGGATFAASDGGWVYVSNSEVARGGGGVGAIRFAADGSIVDAYSILTGTSVNCAGGATPWKTWLSCEEIDFGEAYECDPFAPGSEGVVRPALGTFKHEAAAVDPIHQTIYMTEDQPDGLLYRFTPDAYPSLAAGLLEAAEILDPSGQGPMRANETRDVIWHGIPDPNALGQSTRSQVRVATAFNGGEGCDFSPDGCLYFATKGDDRIWKFDPALDRIEILYERATSPVPILSGVDNVHVTPAGDVLVAEDPGQLQIVSLTPGGDPRALVQVTGQSGSEITGPALSPDGRRLYFSSQRLPGTTYEVRGPF